MPGKIFLLLVILLHCSRFLYSYDTIDTVWSINGLNNNYILSPDNSYVACISTSFYPVIIDAQTGLILKEIIDLNINSSKPLCFTADSKNLIIGGISNKTVIFNLEKDSIISIINIGGTDNQTYNIANSQGGDTIVFYCNEYMILIDFNTGLEIKRIQFPLDINYVDEIKYSPTGNHLIFRLYNRNFFYLFNLKDSSWTRINRGYYRINDISFSNDGSKIIFCDQFAYIYLINVLDTSLITIYRFNGMWRYCYSSIFGTKDSTIIICGSGSGQNENYNLFIIRISDYSTVRNYRIKGKNLSISKDNRFLYFNNFDNSLIKISLDEAQSISKLNEAEYKISVKPDPAQDYIEIDMRVHGCSPNQENEIRIYDSIGDCVMVAMVQNHEFLRLDISDLSQGIYFVQCGKQRSKFIKI